MVVHAPTRWMALNAHGRLELFVVGIAIGGEPQIAVWHLWQTAPGGGWSGWTPHGTPPNTHHNWNGPALAANKDGRLELFFVYFGTLWHIWQTSPGGGWSGWTSHGTPPGLGVAGYPAIGRSADGRLELFAVGGGGSLWHIRQTAPNNGWSDWTPHGTPTGSALRLRPVIASGADGRLELFGVGDDGALWRIWQTKPNGGWSDWTSHGNPPGVALSSLPTPAVAANAGDRLELFVVGEDGALWHTWQTSPNNGWSAWTSRGRPSGVTFKSAGAAVAPSADGRLELFIPGDDGALWHIWQTSPGGGWSGWTSHGRPPAPPGGPPPELWGFPALARNGHGRLELFIAGSDTALWHIWQTTPNGGWSAWTSHGKPPGFGFFGA